MNWIDRLIICSTFMKLKDLCSADHHTSLYLVIVAGVMMLLWQAATIMWDAFKHIITGE